MKRLNFHQQFSFNEHNDDEKLKNVFFLSFKVGIQVRI